MTPSLGGWPTKAKEVPSPHEVRLAMLDTNPVLQSLGQKMSVNFRLKATKIIEKGKHSISTEFQSQAVRGKKLLI